MNSESTPERLKAFRAEGQSQKGWPAGVVVAATLGAAAVGAAVTYAAMKQTPAGPGGLPAAQQRELAAYLVSKNQLAQGLDAYDTYLAQAEIPPENRVKVLYTAAETAIDAEEYERALRYLYEGELIAPDAPLAKDIGKKVVFCLEQLGRSVALSRELSNRSGGEQGSSPGKSAGAVLAEYGDERITARDLERELERLPAAAREGIDTKEQRVEFLRNMVAERLLVDKAHRRGLDEDPEIQERVQRQRDRLMVRKLIDTEVESKLDVTPQDVKRFYEAEIDRFTRPTEARGALGDGATEDTALNAAEQANRTVSVREGRIAGSSYAPDVNAALAKHIFEQAGGEGPVTGAVEVKGRWYAFSGTFRPAQTKPFEEVKADVERAYRDTKKQELVDAMLAETLKARGVTLYPERVEGAAP